MEWPRSFHSASNLPEHFCCCLWLHAFVKIQHAIGPSFIQRSSVKHEKKVSTNGAYWKLVPADRQHQYFIKCCHKCLCMSHYLWCPSMCYVFIWVLWTKQSLIICRLQLLFFYWCIFWSLKCFLQFSGEEPSFNFCLFRVQFTAIWMHQATRVVEYSFPLLMTSKWIQEIWDFLCAYQLSIWEKSMYN